MPVHAAESCGTKDTNDQERHQTTKCPNEPDLDLTLICVEDVRQQYPYEGANHEIHQLS